MGRTAVSDVLYAGGGIGLGPRPEKPAQSRYPAPEEPGHIVLPTCPQKRAVSDLVALAGASGWSAVVTHARGRYPHVTTGRPGPVKDSLAVRLFRRRDVAEYAVAVYVGGSTWSWELLRCWRFGEFPRKYKLLSDFTERLSA
jgi:hypothetical protein